MEVLGDTNQLSYLALGRNNDNFFFFFLWEGKKNNLHSLAFSFFNTIFFSFLITLDSNKTHIAENYVVFNGPPVQFKNAMCITLIDIKL